MVLAYTFYLGLFGLGSSWVYKGYADFNGLEILVKQGILAVCLSCFEVRHDRKEMLGSLRTRQELQRVFGK